MIDRAAERKLPLRGAVCSQCHRWDLSELRGSVGQRRISRKEALPAILQRGHQMRKRTLILRAIVCGRGHRAVKNNQRYSCATKRASKRKCLLAENTAPPTLFAGHEIIWLASYPKSGNTWVREILRQMFFPDVTRMQAVPTYHGADCDTYGEIARAGEICVVAKTHLKSAHEKITGLPNRTNGVLLVKRHPFDVLLSTLNYASVEGEKRVFLKQEIKTVEEIIASDDMRHYIDEFCQLGCSPWFKVATGNTVDFVTGWRAAAKTENVLELRYEDLMDDPARSVQEIAGFFGRKFSDEARAQIVSNSDKNTAQNGTFFWKRRAYNFEKMLTPNQIDHFYAAGGHILDGLGYERA